MNMTRDQLAWNENWDPTVYYQLVCNGVVVRSAGRKVDKCWACKKARQTCDLVYPKCGTCEKAGRKCTGYGTRPLKFLNGLSFDPTTAPDGGKAKKGPLPRGKSPKKKHRFPLDSQAGPAYPRPRRHPVLDYEDDNELSMSRHQPADGQPQSWPTPSRSDAPASLVSARQTAQPCRNDSTGLVPKNSASQGLGPNNVPPQSETQLAPSPKGKEPMRDVPGSQVWTSTGSRMWRGQKTEALATSNSISRPESDRIYVASSEATQPSGRDTNPDVPQHKGLTSKFQRQATPEASKMPPPSPVQNRRITTSTIRNKQLLRDILDSGKWMGWIDPNPLPPASVATLATASDAPILDDASTNCPRAENQAQDETTSPKPKKLVGVDTRFRLELQRISGISSTTRHADTSAPSRTTHRELLVSPMMAVGRHDIVKDTLASTTAVDDRHAEQPLTPTMRSRQARRRDSSRKQYSGQETSAPQQEVSALQSHSSVSRLNITTPRIPGLETVQGRPSRLEPLRERAPIDEHDNWASDKTTTRPSVTSNGTTHFSNTARHFPSEVEGRSSQGEGGETFRFFTRLGLSFTPEWQMDSKTGRYSSLKEGGKQLLQHESSLSCPYPDCCPMSAYKSSSLPERTRTELSTATVGWASSSHKHEQRNSFHPPALHPKQQNAPIRRDIERGATDAVNISGVHDDLPHSTTDRLKLDPAAFPCVNLDPTIYPREDLDPAEYPCAPTAQNNMRTGVNSQVLKPSAFPSCPKAHDATRRNVKPKVLDPSAYPASPEAHDKLRNNDPSPYPFYRGAQSTIQDQVVPMDFQSRYSLPQKLTRKRIISREDVANGYNIIYQQMPSSRYNKDIGAAVRQLQSTPLRRKWSAEKDLNRDSPVMDPNILLVLDLAARLRFEQDQSSINQIQQGPAFLSQMINVFLNTVFPTDHEKQYSLMRHSYLSYLPRLDLGSIPVLKFAVVMLCLSQLGNYHDDTHLSHEAEVFYGKALKTLMLYVPHRVEKAFEATTVLTSMLLLTIRTDTFTSASAPGVDWKVHYRGAEGYLRINGPHWLNICSASDRIIYRNIKEPTLWINLSQRRSPEMTPQEWLNCEESINSRHELFAMALNIAQLLERTEAHCVASNPSSLMQLAEDWLVLRRKLLHWADTNEEQEKELRTMERTLTDVYDADSIDLNNEVHCFLKSHPVFPAFFGFRDGSDELNGPYISLNFEVRWQQNRYWIFCLVMNCALLRLAHYHPGQFSRYLHFDSDYAMFRSVQRAAACLADNLCRLFLYLSVSEQQGDIDFMHVVCDMAKNYYAEIGSLQKFTWCQGVSDAVARRRERLIRNRTRSVCRMRDLHEDLSSLTMWAMPPVPRNY